MVKLLFKKFLVIDNVNKKANEFIFGTGSNIFVSDSNTTGKSSLIKSIYYTLGAEIKNIPFEWKIDQYLFHLVIDIDGNEYIIERQNKIISKRDKDGIVHFSNIKEFSVWLQSVLKMDLFLKTSMKNERNLAYSAAIFSIFYLDQDASWTGTLFKNTFNNLGLYKSNEFQRSLIDFFLGLDDSRIDFLTDEKNTIQAEISDSRNSAKNVQRVYDTYREKTKLVELREFDFANLESDINFYIEMTNNISNSISTIVQKITIEKSELDILKQDRDELTKLSKTIKQRLSDIEFECSYCHSKLSREQSLTRLELEDNAVEIYKKLKELNLKISKSGSKLEGRRNELSKLNQELDLYKFKLSQLKEINSIQDYISQNVLKELDALIVTETKLQLKYQEQEKKISSEIRKLKKDLKARRDNLAGQFEILKNDISLLAGTPYVNDIKFNEYKAVQGSGVANNKAILVMYLVYLNLINRYSNYTFPITIDSFTKQETDREQLIGMYDLINKYFIKLSNQTFFSTIESNLRHLDFQDSQILKLTKPLLIKEKYEEVLEFVINE